MSKKLSLIEFLHWKKKDQDCYSEISWIGNYLVNFCGWHKSSVLRTLCHLLLASVDLRRFTSLYPPLGGCALTEWESDPVGTHWLAPLEYSEGQETKDEALRPFSHSALESLQPGIIPLRASWSGCLCSYFSDEEFETQQVEGLGCLPYCPPPRKYLTTRNSENQKFPNSK